MNRLLYAFALLVACCGAVAQNLTAKIVDAQTGESIPYANILINGSESLISNAEGFFNIPEASAGDSSVITASYMGYVTRAVSVSELKNMQVTLPLQPAAVMIENVDVSNVKPDANQIMAQVKKNLTVHFKSNNQPTKNMLFFRDVSAFKPKEIEIEFTKSTGFSKKALKEVNADIAKFTSRMINQPPKQFTDMLCNYYTVMKTKDNKPLHGLKLEVIKATKLRDESVSTSVEDLEKTTANLFLKHLDTTKFYRVKSGWFGSRDTLSFAKSYNKKKKKNKTVPNEVDASKTSLLTFFTESSLLYNKNFDFVKDLEIYKYTYEGAVLSEDNEFVYVIRFEPRKSRALYSGKLYVSETDFAVVRADYDLVDGKKLSGVNLKLLLGVKQAENLSRGTLIYRKRPSADGYYLQYASVESGSYIYLNRPLKFIELTDEEKDVVAFDLKLEANQTEKIEYLNISQTEITESAFDAATEPAFSYISLKKYDPSIWKNYTAIEPMEEMKRFTVTE